MRSYTNNPAYRLANLKAKHPTNWREWVKYEVNPETLAQGDTRPGNATWYTQSGEYFRNERFCDEVVRLNHMGWFGDTEHCDKLHRGIVACLPHGRFIAGYLMEDNDERVYFSEVFTDEKDAARMADEHARITAETEDEYSGRWNEAMRLESLIEEKKADVCKLREDLQIAIAACAGSVIDSVVWMRAKARRFELRQEASEIIGDVRAFMAERASLKVD